MTLSLDTNVLVELLRGRNIQVRRAFSEARAQGEHLVASLIVSHELYFGAELDVRSSERHLQARALLNSLAVEPFEDRDMRGAARLRADLRRKGLSIGFYDALIAGQAIARDWTVVTANIREFARVSDLKIIDWTAPTGA